MLQLLLVGGFNPPEKYESQLGLLFPNIPNIWKNKKCSKPPTSFHVVFTSLTFKSRRYEVLVVEDVLGSSIVVLPSAIPPVNKRRLQGSSATGRVPISNQKKNGCPTDQIPEEVILQQL